MGCDRFCQAFLFIFNMLIAALASGATLALKTPLPIAER